MSALTVHELTKRVSADQKQGALWTDAMDSITLHSIGQMEGSNEKMHNQVGIAIKSYDTIFSETTQKKPVKLV